MVALLLETVRNPDGFRAGLARAVERDVPVVALTVGRTDASKAMVTAHSGALAGEEPPDEIVVTEGGVRFSLDLKTGYRIGLDFFAWDAPGLEAVKTFHATGKANVRNVTLPAEYSHVFVPATAQLVDQLVDDGAGRAGHRFGQVIAVDESNAMLSAARKRLHGVENVDIRNGRLEALPLADGEVDVLASSSVLEHLGELRTRPLRQLFRDVVPALRRVRDVVALAVLGAAASTAVHATIGSIMILDEDRRTSTAR